MVIENDLNNRSEYIPVVCAADDKYSMPVAVMACSAVANLPSNRKLLLFVIDGGIKENNKQKILNSVDSSRCHIKWLQPSDILLEKMKLSGHISLAAYYRILIPELLSSEFQKVIYLDCDLVLNQNLEQLWQNDIEDKYLLAVQEIKTPYVSAALLNYDKLGIPPDWKYFNSGVLLINLEKWRKDNISTKIIQYVEQNKEYIRFHDQDGLNAVLAGQWGELDPRWNQTPFIYEYSSWENSPFNESTFNNVLNNPWIIHFASSFKPWNAYKYRDKELFYKYLDMTAWAGWRYTFWNAIYRKFIRLITRSEKR
ncbi:glycosyltransferase family 8 protein [Tolypothrix sp. PCC 7910]|uniref:glycosyltransferase family 8 protein n=1 Tax=Tolypothrix sp. PCC 7910 TaxID=2099387 RepID=UPI0014279895|nr:glycosyltransferase family 8 protein [Tolypothrix sp. PCC 7910]QIR37807.1 glycosyltransferase family 8 protein [Tolypothrix sp. PCC 7910]